MYGLPKRLGSKRKLIGSHSMVKGHFGHYLLQVQPLCMLNQYESCCEHAHTEPAAAGLNLKQSSGQKCPLTMLWLPINLRFEPSLLGKPYMKLKPEMVPTWDRNKNTLTRWIEKVGQLANTSSDIFKELGKVVPRRFTNSAEMWYYSIPLENRQPMEQDWGKNSYSRLLDEP